MFESCVEIRHQFSDYLDQSCSFETLRSIRYHLAYCAACREELEAWKLMQMELRALPRLRPRRTVELKLHVRLSRALHESGLDWLKVRLDNLLRPLLLPASVGMLTAVFCFGLLMGTQAVPVTNIPDVPLGESVPPRIYELAPINFNTGDQGVVLLTYIDADGHVKNYRLLSGQHSPELLNHLDRMIYFSNFYPARTFNKPTDGQVILSLRRITVRG